MDLKHFGCESVWGRGWMCVFVVLQKENRPMSSQLKAEGYGTNCLAHFLGCFFFPFPPPLSGLSASLVCAALQGAVVSERFLNVLNPSISLCPGKKYIRMKLKRPTGAKMCEKKMSLFPAICVNREKRGRAAFLLFFFNKWRLKLIWTLFKEQHKALNKWF